MPISAPECLFPLAFSANALSTQQHRPVARVGEDLSVGNEAEAAMEPSMDEDTARSCSTKLKELSRTPPAADRQRELQAEARPLRPIATALAGAS